MDSFRSQRFSRVIRRGLAATSGMNRAASRAGTTSRGPNSSDSGRAAYKADRHEDRQAAGSRGSPARFCSFGCTVTDLL